MNTERYVFIEEHGGLRNGFYERKVKTKFGEIDDLTVPRDREERRMLPHEDSTSRSISRIPDQTLDQIWLKGIYKTKGPRRKTMDVVV